MVATNEDGKGAVIVEKKSSDRGKRCIKIKPGRRKAPWRLV